MACIDGDVAPNSDALTAFRRNLYIASRTSDTVIYGPGVDAKAINLIGHGRDGEVMVRNGTGGWVAGWNSVGRAIPCLSRGIEDGG